MEWFFYVACAFVICSISTYLVCHCDYEDGFLGRIALAALAGAELIVIMDALIEGSEYDIFPSTFVIQCALALFLARHCYRFIRWRHQGAYDWRKANK